MGILRDYLNASIHLAGYTKQARLRNWEKVCREHSPYQPWNCANNAIYVHIPKAGGQAVKAALDIEDHPFLGHCPATGFKAADPRLFEDYYSFSVVRHPVTRLRSAFQYLKHTSLHETDRRFADQHLSKITTFPEFVQKLNDWHFRAMIVPWIHFQPQAYFLADLEGTLIVDEIFKLENIDKGFEQLKRRLGIDATLPKKNASTKSAESDLSPQHTDVIRSIYREDFALLGYE
ncbi:MAG: sulfotransferase family 2 domain-containing protein [Pseudomonadota bacterium]